MFKKDFFYRFAATLQIVAFLFTFSLKSFAQDNSTKIPQTVFSNSAPITINTTSGLTAPTVASAYPSPIMVSGMPGTITKVEVTLKGVSHTLNQLDFLLVSPSGAKYIFLSDSISPGGNDNIYTFSDMGTTTLNNLNSASGTYLPTDVNTGTDTFPTPAPAAPYNLPPSATFASVFNGADPNGVWNLYAVDDTLGTAGSIISGWSLNITTNGAPQTFANPNYISFNDINASASPYGSTINVAGQTGVISNLKVSITGLSHSAPSDIDILLVSPNGKSLVIMSDVPNGAVSNIDLTFDDAAASTINSSPAVSGTYKPTDNFNGMDFFPSPAPLPPYLANNAALNNFNGFNPNGEWRLFVVDDAQSNAGSISGGWSLDITTIPQPPPPLLSCAGPSFSPTSYPTGANPTNLAIADFNNDMKADVAVANQASNDISVLLGNGNGTFGTQVLYPAGSGAYSIVAGKFNADNNFDLAVANSGSNNVSILLGNGDGTFSAPTNFGVGINPISIASADFNNDTKPDLAVVNFGGFFFGTVSILLNNGTGGFTAGTPVRTRTQPSFVATADFSGDGNQDLIITSFGANSVSTFLGNGSGGFQLLQNISTGAGPVSIEIANLDGNNFLDFAVANYNADTLTTCSGNSQSTFNCFTNAANGTNPISVTSGDYVGNGTKTIATALSGSNTVSLLGNSVAVGLFPNAVDTADFNSDGKPDLITANSGTNDISVLINSCLAAKGNLYDYDGNRKTDFAVFRPSNTSYFVQSLNQSGVFKVFGRPNDTLVPADFDGDRRTDFAYYRPESGLWFVQDSASRPIYFLQFGLPNDIPAPADFDGDGKADIAVFRPSSAAWYILRSSDDDFRAVAWGIPSDIPVIGDFEGDGKFDYAVFRPSDGTWYIQKSSDSGTIGFQWGISTDIPIPNAFVR